MLACNFFGSAWIYNEPTFFMAAWVKVLLQVQEMVLHVTVKWITT